MELLAIAIAPGIAISLFILHRDAFNREPKLNLIVSFILGMVSIVPAMIIEDAFYDKSDFSISGILWKAFVVVALTEEAVKYAALRTYSYTRRSFDEPLDGIVYSVMVSMGFATLENILYVQKFGMMVGVQRMFMAVPAHATFGVLMGYFAGKAKFAPPAKRAMLLLTGLLWATFFHGAYDFFLFLGESPEVRQSVSNVLLLAGAITSLIVAARLSLRHINAHRQLSLLANQYQPTALMHGILPSSRPELILRVASSEDITLIRQMAHHIWPLTYQQILSPQQLDYMLQLIYSPAALQSQMQNGQTFFIVLENGQPIGFASIGLMEARHYRLFKIYINPAVQGKGTGRVVMETIMHYLKQTGATQLTLNVNRHNTAKQFYERLGFTVIREEDIDIGNGYYMNDYVMHRLL